MWSELIISIESGDPYVLLIIVLLFAAFVVAFERLIMLEYVFNLNFPKFILNLKKMITSDDMDRATNLCRSIRKKSLPVIALKAIEAAENDPTTVRGTIEEEAIAFLPRIEIGLSLLPAAATMILLLGVLGTIDGLWNTFHSIQVLDTSKKQSLLATGIAGALNPSALGLAGCIFVLGAYQYLKGSAVRLTERMHHGITVLNNLLVPAEVATYVAAASGVATAAPAPAADDQVVGSPAPAEDTSDDDAFDDSAIEDIKDEEEII